MCPFCSGAHTMLGDSLYLDNIEEYVQDANNVVTYKWLSRTLDVPVNVAKQMLYSYVSQCQKSSDNQISVLYAVTGVSDVTKEHQVQLVEDKDLEDTKKQFSSLLGVHVYSVQKQKLKDSGTLYMADYDITEEHLQDYSRWSTIECTAAVKRTSKKATTQSGEVNPPLPKLSHVQSSNDSKQDTLPLKVESAPPKQAAKSQASTSKPKKGSMKSFFGSKDSVKKKEIKVKSEIESNSTESRTNIKSETLSPPLQPPPSKEEASKPPVKSVPAVKEEPQEQTTKSRAAGMFQGLNDSDIDVDDESGDDKPVELKKAAVKKKTKKKTSVTKQEKDTQQQNKRKRVQELSSDEDASDGEVRGDNKDVASTGKRRKKVRRLMPKMYMNESGEMVTEHSWEMVSTDASDEGETEGVEKKRAKKESEERASTDKVSPKKATKQASLRNFFKK